MLKKILLSILLMGCLSMLLVHTSYAQAPALLTKCAPIATQGQETCGAKHLLGLFVSVYNWLLYFASFIALLFIIWSGIQMFFYWLSEHPEQTLQDAKLTLTRAIFGLVVVITAFLLVNTVVFFLTGQDINSFLQSYSGLSL